MSIFGSLFQSKSDKNSVDHWNALQSLEQWETLIDRSFQHPVVIFKHSTRCVISRMALRDFESTGLTSGTNESFYLLDLISFRSVSDAISKHTSVVHQSPQVIVLKNGKAEYNASHSSISYDTVVDYL